jgi:uncharacterized protein with FMN-binding domain
MTTSKHPKQSGRPPIDPLLAQRLQQLGGRRPAGSPLPPPTPGTAARSQAATKQAAARPVARPAANSTQARSAARPQGTTVISTEPPSRRPAAQVQGANAAQTAKLQAAAARAAAARNAKSGGKAAPAGARKGKPAQSSKIASLAISVATTAVLAGIFAHNAGSPVAVTLTGGTAAGTGAGTAGTTGAGATPTTAHSTAAGGGVVPNANAGATASTAAPAAAPAAPAGTVKDGTYVGQTQYNRFGPVQVQAVYAGGQLTDVQILQYEDGDNRSIRINQIALPRLIQQSVAAQGVNIDGVSGATYTTRSYVKSLQSAIDAAKQASGIAG